MKHRIFLVLASSCTVAGFAWAVTPPAETLRAMLACRAIVDPKARLECFDAKSAVVDAANAKGDIAIVDRETLQRARKENFGRQNPKPLIPLGDKEVSEIDTAVTGISFNPDGTLVLTMTDGSVWSQTDGALVGRQPHGGSTVKIRRGTLGSYMISVQGGPGFKARRVR